MSNRADRDLLGDIMEALRRAVAYSEGQSYEQFLKDIKTQDAVKRAPTDGPVAQIKRAAPPPAGGEDPALPAAPGAPPGAGLGGSGLTSSSDLTASGVG